MGRRIQVLLWGADPMRAVGVPRVDGVGRELPLVDVVDGRVPQRDASVVVAAVVAQLRQQDLDVVSRHERVGMLREQAPSLGRVAHDLLSGSPKAVVIELRNELQVIVNVVPFAVVGALAVDSERRDLVQEESEEDDVG